MIIIININLLNYKQAYSLISAIGLSHENTNALGGTAASKL